MIKINLLGEESQEDNSSNYLIAGYAASLVLCLIVFYALSSSIASSIEELSSQKQSLDAQLAKLKESTKEVRELEKKRDDLRNKLTVIASLKRSKIGPVRVMDDLNLSLPDRAWLSEVREKEGLLRISGIALDNQTVSDFAATLGKSDYFPSVEIVVSQNVQYKGVVVKDFALQAKVNYLGKISASVEPESGEASNK